MSRSLATEYRPQTLDEVVEQDNIKVIFKQQLETKEYKPAYLLCGSAGTGKAQPLDSMVLTPYGFVRMGDVYIGQEVITSKNHLAKITGIYPQGKRSIYEITLQDRTKIRVADNHLNVVEWYNQNKKQTEEFVLTTTELIDKMKTTQYKLRVGIPCVDFPFQDILIDPYLLGALIGDGSLCDNFSFSNSEYDIIDKINAILEHDYDRYLRQVTACDYTISPIRDYMYAVEFDGVVYHSLHKLCERLHSMGYPKFDTLTILNLNKSNSTTAKHYPELRDMIKFLDINDSYRVNPLLDALKSYGLTVKSVDKHIPQEYLVNTHEIRLKLLQGLMDTDGYIDKRGSVSFSTSSKQLSEDFAFLVRSLGIRDTVSVSKSRYRDKNGNYVECIDSYDHYLKIPNGLKFYTSEKHESRYRDRQHKPLRNIVSVEYVGEEDCQCIMLDHEDHTYISDNFIPTHNTTLGRIFANEINDHKGTITELDAASNSSVENIREIINQAKTQALDCEYRIYLIDEVHALSSSAFQALLKTLEEPPLKAIFILCTTNPEKIPKTILSRVQRYDLKRISQNGIIDRLAYILSKENLRARGSQEEALAFIAKLADGGMRDAITLMDKCLSYSTELTVENITKALGIANYDVMFSLYDSIVNFDTKCVLSHIDNVYQSGVDIKQFITDFTNMVLDICKYKIYKSFDVIKIPNTYKTTLDGYTDDDFNMAYKLLDVLVKINANIRWELNPRAVFEAELILFMGVSE